MDRLNAFEDNRNESNCGKCKARVCDDCVVDRGFVEIVIRKDLRAKFAKR